jgi:drug/metabolite transporter (DMT)-like permease
LIYRLLLAAAAILFSTGGAAIKAAHLTGWQIASFRSGVAALVLIGALPGARRGWSLRMLPVAAAYAATLLLFVLANRLTTSANAIFLQATAPLWVALLSPLLLREPLRRGDLLYIAAVAVGTSLFFAAADQAVATAPDPRQGNVLALASGVTYALMLLGLRWLGRNGSPDAAVSTVAAGNLLAFVLALAPAMPVAAFTVADLGVISYLGIFQIGLAYWCLARGISRVPAFEAVTMLQLEVAMNPIWTWWIHGERPGALPLTGGVLIVFATLLNTWRQRSASPAKSMLKKRQG